jgi:hypothetical protein
MSPFQFINILKNVTMINGYEFLKYQPEVYKQLECRGMTFVYYDCPQAIKKVDIFTTIDFIGNEKC